METKIGYKITSLDKCGKYTSLMSDWLPFKYITEYIEGLFVSSPIPRTPLFLFNTIEDAHAYCPEAFLVENYSKYQVWECEYTPWINPTPLPPMVTANVEIETFHNIADTRGFRYAIGFYKAKMGIANVPGTVSASSVKLVRKVS